MKRKLIKRILSVALVAAFLLPIFTIAEDTDAECEEETVVINAEDIGIKEIKNELEEADSTEEVVVEDESYNENIIHTEGDFEQKETDKDSISESDEEDVVIPECPEGMSEGYVEGIFFEPNHFGDCNLHEYCYICPECTIVEEVGYDEEINPNGGWYLDKCCIVCGHGTCTPITEKEALGE